MCCSNLCCAALGSPYILCVRVLYVHVVFDDKHVLNLMCVRACIYFYPGPDQANFYMYIFYIFVMLIIYLFLGLLVSISKWFV